MDERKIYTLTDLGKSIRSVLERTYTSTYWIKAEIAKLNFYPRTGHCYPELVDKAGNVIQAQMRATIWAADYKIINKQFAEVAGEPLQEGMSILFRASVGFHPVYGFSLQIWEIEPSYTLGEMAREKTQNIEKLKKEGLFDANKELVMPILPKRIAVISVETSKGYHDFLNILNLHASKYGWWHYLFPSVLQGEKAVEGMLSQLRIIKKVKEKFDFVAIIRGGGGDIGLSCYDDYQLGREIATFPLPVITGIGHATNVTLAEMVAWSNKITPTDVAYFIVDRFKSFENRIDQSAQVVAAKADALLSYSRQTIEHNYSRLTMAPIRCIVNEKNKIYYHASTIVRGIKERSTLLKSEIDGKASRLSGKLPYRLAGEKNHIINLHQKLHSNSISLLKHSTAEIDQSEKIMTLLNPDNVLKRGFSITTLNGKIIRQPSEVNADDLLITRVDGGLIRSRVEENKE
jgi:exodeoxyribonuclease VII large subunit